MCITFTLVDISVFLTNHGFVFQGSLGDTLKEVRPTSFFGVPRVWEKMSERMQEVAKKTKGLKREIGAWAKGIGLKGNARLING